MKNQQNISRAKKSKAVKKAPALKKTSNKLKVNNASSSARMRYFWLGLILLITFISFYPVLKNTFTNWDDNAYVFENTHLSRPISEGIAYFFGPHYFIGNYIPVTMMVYLLQFHAWGLNPEFYHLVNLLIHLLNVALVFWFIYLLSGKKTMVAAMVALFFGIHPMHVKSVAWIAELKDVLYTFFFIGGLIAYYKYCNVAAKKNFKFIAAAFLLFALSLLCKPAAVAFPLVLVLIDFYVDRRFTAKVWLENSFSLWFLSFLELSPSGRSRKIYCCMIIILFFNVCFSPLIHLSAISIKCFFPRVCPSFILTLACRMGNCLFSFISLRSLSFFCFMAFTAHSGIQSLWFSAYCFSLPIYCLCFSSSR